MKYQTSSSLQSIIGFNAYLPFNWHDSIILRLSSLSLFKKIILGSFGPRTSANPLFLLFLLSCHLTPVTTKRPCPPLSFSSEQQYRTFLVGGYFFCGINLHILILGGTIVTSGYSFRIK